MKKAEYIFIFLAVFAIISKILSLPATSALTVLVFSIYALISLIHNGSKTKGGNLNEKILIMLLGIGTAGCLIGIMLIFMTWSFARETLMVSGIFTLGISLVMVYLKISRGTGFIIVKGIVLGALVLVIFSLPKYTIFKLKHLDDPKLVELYINKEELKTDSARTEFNNYLNERRNH